MRRAQSTKTRAHPTISYLFPPPLPPRPDALSSTLTKGPSKHSPKGKPTLDKRPSRLLASSSMAELAVSLPVVLGFQDVVDESYEDLRARRSNAEGTLAGTQQRIAQYDPATHASFAEFISLTSEIASLQALLSYKQSELAKLKTTSHASLYEELCALHATETDLVNEMSLLDLALFELDTNVATAHCLDALDARCLSQWLVDAGLGRLCKRMADVDGPLLATFTAVDIEARRVDYADACALLLAANMAHYGHGASPPSLLAWDKQTTAAWLTTLDAPFSLLASIGLNGAALCSLTHDRVKALLPSDDDICQLRKLIDDRLALDDAPQWARTWTASTSIKHHDPI